MRTWIVAIVAAVVGTSCGGNAEYACGPEHPDHSCGGGMCEATGFCSVSDATCPLGRRYTDGLAGSLSGQCVGGELPSDGGVDARTDALPPDARLFCYGTVPNSICFAAAPTGAKTYSGTIDTASSSMCAPNVVSGGTGLCVLAGGTITVDARLRATGTKPLVLLATDSINVSAQIDVGSHRGMTPETGAGADPTACSTMAGVLPTVGGGGAGGSFLGPGGAGAVSALANSTAGSSGGPVSLTGLTLRGGCPGQDGEGANKGTGGHGGGAVMLIASSITIGASILAGGEGGDGGGMNTSGGGGGGAGGAIWLDAPTVTNVGNNLILANGGAGGEGSGVNAGGLPGGDATATTAASGGNSGVSNGGDGGDGSATIASGSMGFLGTVVMGAAGGGGAGGGGAGIVKVRTGVNLGNKVSPATTPL